MERMHLVGFVRKNRERAADGEQQTEHAEHARDDPEGEQPAVRDGRRCLHVHGVPSRHGRVAPSGSAGTPGNAPSALTFAPAVCAGKDPVIAVPLPGVETTTSAPPSAASRSAIPCSPVPYKVAAAPNPTPSSRIENSRPPGTSRSWIVAEVAAADFAMFFLASRPYMWPAASTSGTYRLSLPASALTGTGDRLACASRAAPRP